MSISQTQEKRNTMKTFSIVLFLSFLLIGCGQQSSHHTYLYDYSTEELQWKDLTLSTPDKKQDALNIEILEIEDYLQLTICPSTKNDTSFVFPRIDGESYYIPISEGKFFSSKDSLWIHHLRGEEYSAIENLSMPFFAVGKGDKAIVYILENPYRSSLCFKGDRALQIEVKNDFFNIDTIKQNQIRIYVTNNDPVSIASIYRKYVTMTRGLVTLKKKAEKNQNITKLFGAPHFYLWDRSRNAVAIIHDMAKNGIKKAWIGFETWEEDTDSRYLVEQIEHRGYLVGPYDSYHSIHEPNNEHWETASFQDTTLYSQATIKKKNQEYVPGFLKRGRLLNPALSMGEVRHRTSTMLSTKVPFNSWFIDCDATGETKDDYTHSHPTTKQQNIEYRISRMAYIRDSLKMVIGSEGGNDFACSTIAFAHGMEMPVFTWMDWEMNKEPNSKYYVGSYYTPQKGRVATRFSKQIPLKEKLYNLFYNPVYSVPLYKLVYNEVVVTANHWEWPSLKVTALINERMLYEIAYNAAPMYHLDSVEWKKHKQTITTHVKIWTEFHKAAITEQMTNFKYLTNDKKIQLTKYGEWLYVITNYSDVSFVYQSKSIPPKSQLIINKNTTTIYTPKTY